MYNVMKAEEEEFKNNYIEINKLGSKYNIDTEEKINDIIRLVELFKYFSDRGIRFSLEKIN